MTRLIPTALLIFAGLAAPAGAASFETPRTLADDAESSQIAAARGAVAWASKSGLWLANGAGDARRLMPGSATASRVEIATTPGEQPVVTWTDELWRLHAHTSAGEQIIAGTPPYIRDTALTPGAVGLIGVETDKTRPIQVARLRPGGRFGAAETVAWEKGTPHGLEASGSVFAFGADDGSHRRVAAFALSGPGADWVTGAGRDASPADISVGPNGAGVLALVEGRPLGAVRVAPIADGRLTGPVQTLSSPGASAPSVAVGRDGTAVVAWHQGGAVLASVRRPGGAFGEPASFPAPTYRGLAVSVTDDGVAIVAFLDDEQLRAAAAPAGAFGPPERLADGAIWVVAADADVTWIEGSRIRTTHLAGAPVVEPPVGGTAGDRRKPRLRVKVLERKGGKARVRVRSDERGALRATWRSRKKVVGRSRGKLRRGVPRVITTKARKRLTVTIRVTDAAGNVARAKKKVG